MCCKLGTKLALSESTKKGSFNDDGVAWLVVATSSANGFSRDLAGAAATLMSVRLFKDVKHVSDVPAQQPFLSIADTEKHCQENKLEKSMNTYFFFLFR